MFKRVFITVVGALASYLAVRYTTKFLEEKPLKVRVKNVKGKVVHFKNGLRTRTHKKVDKLSAKVDNHIDGEIE